MSNTQNITRAALSNYFGSERFYRHWMGGFVMTEGIEFLNANGAAWLADAIISHAIFTKKVAREEFVVATLKVNLEKKSCVLTFDNGNGKVLAKQEIEYTDFPLAEISFYVENKTLMLPSER